MTGRLLLLVLLSTPIAFGCSSLQRPTTGTLVDLGTKPGPKTKNRVPRRTLKAAEASETVESRDKERRVVEAVEPARDGNNWAAGTRRRLARVAKDIRADLDFHDSEGLEAFAPDALEQVNALRGDMNGHGSITR